jgi:hypothetical protein
MSQTTLGPQVPHFPDRRDAGVLVDRTRPRQTEAPRSPFREVLAGSVAVLMSGAQVATHVLGAPRLAAAIAGAEPHATAAVAGRGVTSRDLPFKNRGVDESTGSPASAGGDTATAADTATAVTAALPGGSDSTDMAAMQAMQRESQVFNMQLLELQEEVQQENRRFTTVSNVLRAKHDTAKAAVSNIRS